MQNTLILHRSLISSHTTNATQLLPHYINCRTAANICRKLANTCTRRIKIHSRDTSLFQFRGKHTVLACKQQTGPFLNKKQLRLCTRCRFPRYGLNQPSFSMGCRSRYCRLLEFYVIVCNTTALFRSAIPLAGAFNRTERNKRHLQQSTPVKRRPAL